MRVYLRENLAFAVSLVLVLALGLVYVFSGDLIVVNTHDQLDGEVLTYLMQAKHFGASYYEELMNGIPASGLQMAAPGMLLFYLAFPAEVAFSFGYLFVMVVAFCGQYLLMRDFGVRQWVAAVTALSFALLPFYSVYGLSVMGLPLVFFSVKRLWDFPKRTTLVGAVMASVFQAVFSSLVLSGFVTLFLLLALCIVSACKRDMKRTGCLAIAFTAMALCYVFQNVDLITQIMGLSGNVSHKSDYELSAEPVSLMAVLAFLLGGQYHAVSNHIFIVCFAVFAVLVGVACSAKRGHREKERMAVEDVQIIRTLLCLLLSALGIAIFYVLFHGATVTSLREMLPGSLKAFQFDRVYWLYPAIWFSVLGLAGEFVLRTSSKKRGKRAMGCAFLLCCALTVTLSCSTNQIVSTLGNYINRDAPKGSLTWRNFFSEEMFEEIQLDLGVEKKDTRILSVGLFPSIASYNGWYCLDAYSNNYPLEYKRQFREIIAGELDEDPILKSYFDGWGNRCYVFSHELGKRFLIQKNEGLVLKEFKINTEAAKAMGCGYIFSAVPIENLANSLLFEKRYSSDDAYYEVWVYKIV